MTAVITGRSRRCPTCRSSMFCASCQQRIRYGDPRPNDTWASRLWLSEEQVDLLLVAAAEFMELHQQFVERAHKNDLPEPTPPSMVDFVDWVRPSVKEKVILREYDGSPGHPFPIPVASDGVRRVR